MTHASPNFLTVFVNTSFLCKMIYKNKHKRKTQQYALNINL